MELLFAFLELITDPFSSTENSSSRTSSFIYRLLLFLGILWFVIELRFILLLQSPVIFLATYFVLSAGMGVLLVVGLFYLRIFDSIKRSHFLIIVFALTLLLVSSSSYFNRKSSYKLMFSTAAAQNERSLP